MVRIKCDGINSLYNKIRNKKLICFGAGRHFDTVMNLYKSFDLASHIVAIIDNDSRLRKSERVWNGKKFIIEALDYINEIDNPQEYVFLITCHLYSMEIVEQLDKIEKLNGIEVYIGSFLSDNLKYKGGYTVGENHESRIPKVIHYCWFGKQGLPIEYEKYIKTWEKYCPDYTIKLWNETNFNIEQNKYMAQAYKEKKWAFVSDYARIKIIHEEGGIYLDCDVELLKSFNDFLGYDLFCGFEDDNHINFGLGFGAVKGQAVLSDLLALYDSLEFIKKDGALNLTPCTAYQTDMIIKYGFNAKNAFQCHNNIATFPTEIFAPVSPWGIDHTDELAYSIHHYSASWQEKDNMSRIKCMYDKYYSRLIDTKEL